MSGAAVIAPTLNGEGRVPADQAAIPEKIGSPLPPADLEHEGRIITHETDPMGQAPCGKTEVLICVHNSEDEYQWIEIGEST